jgi:hypothetical protein
MDFRLELHVKPFANQFNIRQKVMLTGSCFTEHISSRLRELRFGVMDNPAGVVFNPLSIEQAIADWIANRRYSTEDIFHHNEIWQSWNFHGSFASVNANECLERMNTRTTEAHAFLKNAGWLIITLGSAFVYTLNDESLGGTKDMVVANCHKVPASHFTHRLATMEEVEASLTNIILAVGDYNPACRILFTISPVRHYREGLVENNISKGILHNAVYAMQQQFSRVHYFPAYELIIDDLRDYRFYAEDLVHPNYAATQYVWEKFEAACFDDETRKLIVPLQDILRAFRHKPFNPESAQHAKFLATYHQKAIAFQASNPFLDMKDIIAYFHRQLEISTAGLR